MLIMNLILQKIFCGQNETVQMRLVEAQEDKRYPCRIEKIPQATTVSELSMFNWHVAQKRSSILENRMVG